MFENGSGIVDQNVHTAQLLNGGFYHALHLVRPGYIGLNENMSLTGQRPERCLRSALVLMVVQCYSSSSGSELLGHSPTNAPRSTGDKSGFVVEIHFEPSLYTCDSVGPHEEKEGLWDFA